MFKDVQLGEIGNNDVDEVFKDVQLREMGNRDVDEVFKDVQLGETRMLMKCSRMFSLGKQGC